MKKTFLLSILAISTSLYTPMYALSFTKYSYVFNGFKELKNILVSWLRMEQKYQEVRIVENFDIKKSLEGYRSLYKEKHNNFNNVHGPVCQDYKDAKIEIIKEHSSTYNKWVASWKKLFSTESVDKVFEVSERVDTARVGDVAPVFSGNSRADKKEVADFLSNNFRIAAEVLDEYSNCLENQDFSEQMCEDLLALLVMSLVDPDDAQNAAIQADKTILYTLKKLKQQR